MNDEELKAAAKKLGYVLVKKPCYQCSCYLPYPNESHKQKNGRWKCVDRYEPIEFDRKSLYSPITKCVRKEMNKKT